MLAENQWRAHGNSPSERSTTSSANRIRFRITFNFVMALLMAVVVIYGFSHTIGANLIHPSIPRPRVLYVHAALFRAFMAIYILQTGLVASDNVKLHQRLGPIWVVIGAAMPVLGIATGIVMRRFDIIHFNDYATFIAVILWDMLAFSTLFLLAVGMAKAPRIPSSLHVSGDLWPDGRWLLALSLDRTDRHLRPEFLGRLPRAVRRGNCSDGHRDDPRSHRSAPSPHRVQGGSAFDSRRAVAGGCLV